MSHTHATRTASRHPVGAPFCASTRTENRPAISFFRVILLFGSEAQVSSPSRKERALLEIGMLLVLVSMNGRISSPRSRAATMGRETLSAALPHCRITQRQICSRLLVLSGDAGGILQLFRHARRDQSQSTFAQSGPISLPSAGHFAEIQETTRSRQYLQQFCAKTTGPSMCLSRIRTQSMDVFGGGPCHGRAKSSTRTQTGSSG